MKVTSAVILAGVFLGYGATAYAQADAQANASANASVQVDKSSAQASTDHSANASATAGQNSASLANGTAMNATLSQSLDARKNHAGDEVIAKTTQATKSEGKVIIPKGTRLIGHVTEAKARAKGESESALGVIFDKAVLKGGQEIPLNVTIQALAVAQSAVSGSAGGDDFATDAGAGAVSSGRASAGGALGGVTSAAGGAAGAVTNTAANVGGVAGGAADAAVNSTANVAGASHGAIGGLNAAGQLTSNSQGVFGLRGLNLNSSVANSTEGSVITSTGKNVHLDSGTQMVLVAHGQASAGSAKP
jgi:hypothetical protein